MVRSRAAEWHIKTDRVGILGFSAGGELAAYAAMKHDPGQKDAADVIEQQSSRPDFQALIYPGSSGSFTAETGMPPVFIAAGYSDRPDIAEGMASLYLKYKAAKVPAELHLFANAGHGFGYRHNAKPSRRRSLARTLHGMAHRQRPAERFGNQTALRTWRTDLKTALLTLLMLVSLPLRADDTAWTPTKDASKDATINGRAMETFEAGVKPEWGYAASQQDTFIVVHPKVERQKAPLYVVLHSAGHDVNKCVNCTRDIGNHDIYRSPDDFYALYLIAVATQNAIGGGAACTAKTRN